MIENHKRLILDHPLIDFFPFDRERVLSVMYFPENVEQRSLYFRLKIIAKLKNEIILNKNESRSVCPELYEFIKTGNYVTSENLAKKEIAISLDELFEILEFYDFRSLEEKAHAQHPRFSGLIVQALQSIKTVGQEPSLRKATVWLDEYLEDLPLVHSERTFQKIWGKYKNVAHLWAAYLSEINRSRNRTIDIFSKPPKRFTKFLEAASWHEHFLTNTIPKGRSDPFVLEKEIWSIGIPSPTYIPPKQLSKGLKKIKSFLINEYPEILKMLRP